MRWPRFALLPVLGILGPALPRAWPAGFGLFRNYWGDVIVNTDTTAAGRALTPPTREQPVYYLGRSLGSKLGSIRGDRPPEDREMNQFVTKILAKQGYLGATTGGHEPALYLVVQWGYLDPRSNDLSWFLGYDPAKDVASPVFPGMLGAEVWRRGFRSHAIETILENARDANYGIIVTAFEFKSARTPNPVVYWQTRIALPTNGKSMTDALPAMLLAAGDAIGRPNDSPVLRSADTGPEGHVKLGDLQFLDVLSDSPRHPDAAGKN